MKPEILLQVILSPILGAIIGYIFSKIGISGKTRVVEYYLKRVDLINKLLSSENIEINKSLLKKEIEEITIYISLSSVKNYEVAQIEYNNRPWYKKIVQLPKAHTLSGKIATFIFYLYGVTGLIYIPMTIEVMHTEERNEIGYSFLLGLGLSFVIAVLCRRWAISVANRYAILERAKRELFLNDKLINKSISLLPCQRKCFPIRQNEINLKLFVGFSYE